MANTMSAKKENVSDLDKLPVEIRHSIYGLLASSPSEVNLSLSTYEVYAINFERKDVKVIIYRTPLAELCQASKASKDDVQRWFEHVPAKIKEENGYLDSPTFGLMNKETKLNLIFSSHYKGMCFQCQLGPSNELQFPHLFEGVVRIFLQALSSAIKKQGDDILLEDDDDDEKTTDELVSDFESW